MVAAMKAFANEERTNNEDMVKIMKLFSDSEREAMARYLAATEVKLIPNAYYCPSPCGRGRGDVQQ